MSKVFRILVAAAALTAPVVSLPANASQQGDYMTMLAAQNMMGNPATAGMGAAAFQNYAAQRGAYGATYGAVPYGAVPYYNSGYAPGYAAPVYGSAYPQPYHRYWHHW